MRHNMIPNIETLETRLAPALAIYGTIFGTKSTPTPTMANFTTATTGSCQEAVKIDYGSAKVSGSADPDGDGI